MITTQWDAYLQERYENKSRWQVSLSNGMVVYQDDERNGESSWKLLRRYLLDNEDVYIIGMFVGFRDNIIQLPDNADGYFFRNALLSCINEWEKHSFIVGTLVDDSHISVSKYELPEMTFLGTELRHIDDAGESLILCKKKAQVSI
jgi:hypothetical protein